MTPEAELPPERARILVADDQPDVLTALRLLLKNEGFETETLDSPEGVVEAVRHGRFDLLLLDLNYARDTTSGGEGLELLARIRRLDSGLPVVLMTAWGSMDLAVRAMRGGGCDFIEKPWDNRTLLDILRRHVQEGRRRRERMRREASAVSLMDQLAEARRIQERLLPARLSELFPGCEIRAAWRPAGEVGGDYFDAIRLGPARLAFCIADVQGKGLAAALLMSNIQAAVRALAPGALGPGELCSKLNGVVRENTGGRRFVTFFYGVLDTGDRTLRYANAGHLPPVLMRSAGCPVRLRECGAVLGIFPDAAYEVREVRLQEGDRLVLMTDGITEAMNARDEEFGEERFLGLLAEGRHLPAAELEHRLLDEVSSFSGRRLHDDATLMMLSIR